MDNKELALQMVAEKEVNEAEIDAMIAQCEADEPLTDECDLCGTEYVVDLSAEDTWCCSNCQPN